MFGFKKTTATQTEEKPKTGFFSSLTRSLKRTRSQFSEGLANLFLGKKVIDEQLLEDIETQLLVADVGVNATQKIVQAITARVKRNELSSPDALVETLKQELKTILTPVEQALPIEDTHKPFVILMVGINGAGKTTTIGKLAKRLQNEGKSVMLAAGDTFRAAAVEQLQVWGERNQIAVISQHSGADSASVIYDALEAAKARKIDVLIADTAGRLHTQSNLMEELKKIKRVMGKIDGTAPHEIMLILDAGTGQNALRQAQQFHEAVGVTGITITKLDGTAKGGIIFSLAETMRLPIRFIGVGEAIDDLQTFDTQAFVDALFNDKE
jgi:fused signal recognition particle receptor